MKNKSNSNTNLLIIILLAFAIGYIVSDFINEEKLKKCEKSKCLLCR